MSRPSPASPLQASTRLGAVHLRVADLGRQVAFYRDVLDLELQSEDDASASLGAEGGEPLLVLTLDPQAQKSRRTAGLYHFCLAVERRQELGWWLKRLLELETPLQGLVDHRMAEAIYLQDPEGNGIELNWDRPRSEWRPWSEWLAMGNAPLDVQGLLDELDQHPVEALPDDVRVGHIHLHVGDLDASKAFYHGLIGLDISTEIPGQAVFTSAGGYHHHVAFNVWNGRGAAPAPEHATGLDYFSFHVSKGDLSAIRSRLKAAPWAFEDLAQGMLVKDASGNSILFQA
jgi:catechol 2,3-dioxygenase